jgi:tetratricopeptide (TPR) repeat protein
MRPAFPHASVFLFLIAAATLGARGAPVQGPPAPSTDPIVLEFEAASAPGLGDSTEARLVRFAGAHPRHALAAEAQFDLGRLAYARGNYADARARFHRARWGLVSEEARYWEGLSAYALGKPRETREVVQGTARSRKEVPRRWDSAYLVALSWAQEGRRPEALAAYRELFVLPAGSAQAAALYQAQRLAAELERTEDADEWGRRLLVRYPRSPEAASFRAERASATAGAGATR